MKQQVTIANATDQSILPTTNASAELEKAGSANAENDKNKQDRNEQPNKWVVFAILAVGIFMATLDTSIVNISLPTIAHFFAVPLSGAVEWVIIAYLVVSAGVLLTVGRLADSIGRKPIWVAGLIIFTAGSALSGASVSLGMLIAARALQGLGGAFILAISPAMLTSAFPTHERGRALGLNAVIVALGVSVGPTLGGIITENFSWNWIFYVNVPLGIIGIIATLRVLRERANRGRGRFDPVGALLLAIGLVALTLGLSFGQQWGWNSPLLMSTLVISALGFSGLVIVERHVPNPIIDVVLLRSRVFLSANVSLILSFLALFAVSFLLPFYLEELRGYSTLQAGLLLTPLALTIAVIAPFSGALADRIGTRWLASAGLAIACVGLVFMSQLNAQSSTFDIIWRLVFTGAGQALFQSPNNSALMGAAPRGHQGSASGFLATGRVVGQSVSVALAGAIFASLGGSAAGSATGCQSSASNAVTCSYRPVATNLREWISYGIYRVSRHCRCWRLHITGARQRRKEERAMIADIDHLHSKEHIVGRNGHGAHVERQPKQVNYPRLLALGRELLLAIGEDPEREGLLETPRRWADAWREFMEYDPGTTETTFGSTSIDQIVCVSGLRVWSLCEHHLLPFWCDVSIGYLPDEKVLGLSKFARIAHQCAHRLQLQERLGQQIAEEISRITGTENVAVVLKGEHVCMTARGIRTPGLMTSSTMRGVFRTQSETRMEFLRLIA